MIIIQLLLQMNAARRLVDPKECYPRSIRIAVEHGHLNCVILLSEECHYGHVNDVNDSDDTPLHIACRCGHLEIVKYLLTQKACTEICNRIEGTALSCAAAQGHDMIVQYLLNNGASTAGGYHKSCLKVTPLLLAAMNGHTNVVKILLQHDVEINLRNSCGRNFLCEAIINGHQSTVIAILSNDTYWKQAMQFKTTNNETPLRLLVEHMPEMAEMALSRCVSTKYQTDSRGYRTPEHITYSFELMDDFCVPYSNIKGFMKHIGLLQYTQNSLPTDHVQSLDANSFTLRSTGKSANKIDSDTVTRLLEQDEDSEKWMQSDYDADNHVLNLMVSV